MGGSTGSAATRLAQVKRELSTESDLDAPWNEITVAVPGAAYAGIVRADGRDGLVAQVSTDVVADQLDRSQADLHQGPGIAALRQHRTISVPDVARETRWPEFTAAATRRGVGSTLSLPLFADDEALGALNLYATTPRGFTADDETTAELFAADAARVLRNAAKHQQLSYAAASRAVIGQATGILMARRRITAGEASDTLAAAAQQTKLKLVDVARWLVSDHEHPPQDGSG